ncbi:spore coat protein [Thalassotalea insulae]|uniref:Spore coat protein n=1 Tax=Thalassotalea insulae TaxID=2056778 RepID=A0ABQ6GQE9_9GAMM|nr:glycosyltransferase family protein [Thalassotalea insulae]GLX77632.1 spore coat protein [Thalassotalea insulae]
MSINIILQARMSSTRLPGKVLKPILGVPMLAHQLARLKQLKTINDIIVATSIEPDDDAIEQLCLDLKINCFRGSLSNVLERYYQAHLQFPSEHVIRITGDCPVIDVNIINKVINLHMSTHADYTSNCIPATLPDGLDVEIFTAKALKVARNNAISPIEFEHVTTYFRNHAEQFNYQNYTHPTDYSHLRWTVDEPEDFELIQQFFQYLSPKKPYFDLNDILALLTEHPELNQINSKFKRNEGLKKSQLADNLISKQQK